jgi:hypothetical protein
MKSVLGHKYLASNSLTSLSSLCLYACVPPMCACVCMCMYEGIGDRGNAIYQVSFTVVVCEIRPLTG